MEERKVTTCHRTCSVCKSLKAPMFCFPKDLARREVWRLFFGLESATDYMQICSGHFRAEDMREGSGRSRLVRHAFPRIKIPECGKLNSRGHSHQPGKPRCIVPGCLNISKGDISLHHFPRLYGRRCQWATLINLVKVPSRHNFICSSHFVPSDFQGSGSQKSLKCRATPSVNLEVSQESGNNPEVVDVDGEGDLSNSENGGLPKSREEKTELEVEPDNPNYGRLVRTGAISDSHCDTSEEEDLENESLPGGSQDALSRRWLSPLSSSQEDRGCLSLPQEETHIKAEKEESQPCKEKLGSNNDTEKLLSSFKSLSSKLLEDISDIINSPAVSNKSYVNTSALISSDDEESSPPPEPCVFDKLESDWQLKSFTNVTFATFNYLLKLVLELYGEDDPKFPMKKKMFLALSKLRLNRNYECLSVLVGFPRRMCGAYFADTLHLLAVALKNSVTWPSKEEITFNMPKCFETFSDTRVILCCFKVPLTSGDCSKYPIRLYVPSKGGQSVKIVVGFAPSGLVIFVSEVYGGRASDEEIFEDCDLLAKLDPCVDALMVDKGFTIHDVCQKQGIRVYTSPFVLKKQRLLEANAKKISDRSDAWAHVKKVIDRIKMFKVLQSKISGSVVPHLDDILVVTAGLVNLSPPILSDNEFITIKREA